MFENDVLYFASDPELRRAGFCYQTLAHWRMQGRGPKFLKIGSRVAYRGEHLNQWLDAQIVDPAVAVA